MGSREAEVMGTGTYTLSPPCAVQRGLWRGTGVKQQLELAPSLHRQQMRSMKLGPREQATHLRGENDLVFREPNLSPIRELHVSTNAWDEIGDRNTCGVEECRVDSHLHDVRRG